MAFFEFLASLGQSLTSTLNLFIKPVGGQGTNNIFPSPKTGIPPNPGMTGAGVITQDSDGSLRARASILSTRQGLRDDFSGASLNTTLTGTPTFTNGSTSVTGSGTLFTTELSRDFYIKVSAQAETTWAKVRRIISDTSLELEANYTGATATAASQKTKWPTATGTGGSFTVGSSLVNVVSGTTSGAITYISRALDFVNLYAAFNGLTITQRIANQSGFAGVFDNVSSPTQQAAIIFDGTTNTTFKFRTSFSSAATDIQETTVTLPLALTSAGSAINYVIMVDGQNATLTVDGIVVASHAVHMEEPFTSMIAAMGFNNTGAPASTTTLTADSIYLRAYDPIDAPAANTGGILPTDEVHYLYGTVTTSSTTADQVIISTTVPTGKVAWLYFYAMSFSGSGTPNPFKVGKNTVTTEPASPGTVDGVIVLAGIGAGNPPIYQQELPVPIPLGGPGDVIKMTVTPSANQSTVYRGTFIYLLRKT